MARNRDEGDRTRETWWWALSLEEVEAEWCLVNWGVRLGEDEVDDLWYYSWDGELMNYQPIEGYQECGPVEPEYPPPNPPPPVAGGLL